MGYKVVTKWYRTVLVYFNLTNIDDFCLLVVRIYSNTDNIARTAKSSGYNF